jgi:hypothetical protein
MLAQAPGLLTANAKESENAECPKQMQGLFMSCR